MVVRAVVVEIMQVAIRTEPAQVDRATAAAMDLQCTQTHLEVVVVVVVQAELVLISLHQVRPLVVQAAQAYSMPSTALVITGQAVVVMAGTAQAHEAEMVVLVVEVVEVVQILQVRQVQAVAQH
jgi:hypothetical protein